MRLAPIRPRLTSACSGVRFASSSVRGPASVAASAATLRAVVPLRRITALRRNGDRAFDRFAAAQPQLRRFAAQSPPPDGPKPLGPEAGEVKPGTDNIQFTWTSALFTCAVAGGCLWYYDYVKRTKESESRATVRHERIGTPKLGGPFELVDRKGVKRTEQDYKGQYLLIYFGFTNCPDICPQEMEKQTHVIEIIEKEFGPVATPVFISIDPKRDSVAHVDDYCKEFHPRIVGLTGTQEQVKKVSRAYRVYFNEGVKNSEQDYLVDHSIIHYFVNRQGKFQEFFGKNMTAQEIAAVVRRHILQDKEKAQQRKAKHGASSNADEEDD